MKGLWKCTGSTGKVFPEVDLIEGEWNDYDEKVSFYNDDSPYFDPSSLRPHYL